MSVMPDRLLIIALISALMILPACVTTTADTDAIRGDVLQLKRETYDLKKDTLDLRTELNSTKTAASGAVKEDAFNAIRESQTAMFSQVSDISRELQVMRGRFDENKFHTEKTLKEGSAEKELFRTQIASVENRLKDLNSTIENRFKELNEKVMKLNDAVSAQQQKIPAGDPAVSADKPAEEKTVKPEQQRADDKNSADDPIKLYDSAYSSYKEKRYAEARERFILFIKKYPKERLSDRAQFWVAETLYSEKDYEGSILAYETLIKAYPKSEKVPEALLKQGIAFIELGDKKTAKILFEKLIEKYPESKEVDAAKKRLSELNARSKKKR